MSHSQNKCSTRKKIPPFEKLASEASHSPIIQKTWFASKRLCIKGYFCGFLRHIFLLVKIPSIRILFQNVGMMIVQMLKGMVVNLLCDDYDEYSLKN